MKVTYDPEADALYITLRNSEVERSSDLEGGMVIDYDKDGGVVGVEILHASRRIENPHAVEYAVSAEE